jgi:hypothetical protein
MHIGSILRQTPADLPVGVEASIPSWLPLPPGRYASTLGSLIGDISPLCHNGWVAWQSSTYEVVAGQTDWAVLPPPYDATTTTSTISVDEHPGWLTDDHGIATVVVPMPDGSTFFLAGTDPASEVADLAAHALPHRDDLMPQQCAPPTPTGLLSGMGTKARKAM